MKIAIIDADLIGKKKQRFPNLACMKLSAFYKSQGNEVDLVTDYKNLYYDGNIWVEYQVALSKYVKKQTPKTSETLGKCMVKCFDKQNIKYDHIFISKVFTDTEIDEDFLTLDIVEYGGTGFFYDKAPPLPYEIEHIKPDYHLYDDFVQERINKGESPRSLRYYTDFSIGFTTRGCIRGCSFCVNKNYRVCNKHSPISEFLDNDRKYICLLDDNVLSCRQWKEIFTELQATGKRFQFKQGMDERLLTDEKCEIIFKSNWIDDFIFAFDNIRDRRIVEKKLKLIREHTDKRIKFYCFCAYNHDRPDDISSYTKGFWKNDISDLFERIKILMSYQASPYIMRYKDYELSPYKGIYIAVAAWCNQPGIFKSMSFREFCMRKSKATARYLTEFENACPQIATKYFDMKWSDYLNGGE